MSIPLPPIYRDCRRLQVHIEEVVRRFSRYHKYTVGADLRRQAMALMCGVHRAVHDRAQQAGPVQALVWQVDDYKLTLQLAMEVGAFVPARATQPKRSAPGTASGGSGTAGLSGGGPPISPSCRRCWVATGAILLMLTVCACTARLFARMPWLKVYFTLQADASLSVNMPARWQVLRLRAMRRFFNPKGK